MMFVKFFHLEFQKLSVNINSHDFLPKAPEITTLFSTSESLSMILSHFRNSQEMETV